MSTDIHILFTTFSTVDHPSSGAVLLYEIGSSLLNAHLKRAAVVVCATYILDLIMSRQIPKHSRYE